MAIAGWHTAACFRSHLPAAGRPRFRARSAVARVESANQVEYVERHRVIDHSSSELWPEAVPESTEATRVPQPLSGADNAAVKLTCTLDLYLSLDDVNWVDGNPSHRTSDGTANEWDQRLRDAPKIEECGLGEVVRDKVEGVCSAEFHESRPVRRQRVGERASRSEG